MQQQQHMQETSPVGTTVEVGVMLKELICGCTSISGLVEIQPQASGKSPTRPWTKFERGNTW